MNVNDAIFFIVLQPLAELMNSLVAQGQANGVQLNEIWMRQYQVLFLFFFTWFVVRQIVCVGIAK